MDDEGDNALPHAPIHVMVGIDERLGNQREKDPGAWIHYGPSIGLLVDLLPLEL